MFRGFLAFLTFSVILSSTVAGLLSVGRQGFSVFWNMPTAKCQRRYGVSLPLQKYGIVHNPGERFVGENISLYYKQQLGLYPYVNRQGSNVHGGIPQLGDLQMHLALTEWQLKRSMGRGFSGLAVLDWEAWRPLWGQNFGSKQVYRTFSKELVWLKHPEMPEGEVTSLARSEFQSAARAFMEETLALGTRLHSGGLWGFYGFPSCYNVHGIKDDTYTGQCKPGTVEMNDRLTFLWKGSTALYPSVYVPRGLAGHSNARLMVRHRVLEALRVASQHAPGSQTVPVLPYARVAFTRTLRFLNQTDLENTLGESAALGAAGVVLWGSLDFAKSKRQCGALQDYVSSVLGVYVERLRRGVTLCSENVCRARGRCVRRDPHSGHMIPLLDPSVQFNSSLSSGFRCVCYEGWEGDQCEKKITPRSEVTKHPADTHHPSNQLQ